MLDIAEKNGEFITFSNTPQIVGHFNDEKMKQVFDNIKTVSCDTASSVVAMCSVYKLILSVVKKESGLQKKSKSKIQPTIECITGHYTENISMTLADLCFIRRKDKAARGRFAPAQAYHIGSSLSSNFRIINAE